MFWRWPSVRAVAAVFVLPAASALAFEEEGHLLTTAGVVYLSNPPAAGVVAARATAQLGDDLLASEQARKTVVLCAQLPDQTLEYDAINVFTHNLRQGTRASARWMRWVQQLIHALTGGNRDVMRQCAGRLVRTLHQRASASHALSDYCATGLGVHLLGDSYAHWRFDPPNALYGTGLGHAADYHEPDLPFYDAPGPHGAASWQGCAQALHAALDLPEPAAGMTAFTSAVVPVILRADTARGWWPRLERELRGDDAEGRGKLQLAAAIDGQLLQVDPTRGKDPTALPAEGGLFSGIACDDYLAATSIKAPALYAGGLECGAVWLTYANAAAGVMMSPECRDAFASESDWRDARPDGGYPR